MVKIKTIHIDFTSTNNVLPDGYILGYVGEHNATELVVIPPSEMSENENIAFYCLAFEVGKAFTRVIVRSEMIVKAETITVSLWGQTTVSENANIQLEAYDGNNSLLVKSQVVSVEFLPSVNGIQAATDTNGNSLAANVAANTAKLNNFSEDANGNLLYKEKEISGERPTATETFLYEDWQIIAESSNITNGFMVRSVATDGENNPITLIPVGTEIKTIELLYNGEYVDIHRMNEIDNIPYILNLNRVYYSEALQSYIFAIVFCPTINNTVADLLIADAIYEIRITYYTD